MSQTVDESALAGAGREEADPSIEAPEPEGRAPVVLQVLPALEAGGVERGTIDIALALAEAGWGSVVASSGGAMAVELSRRDIPHVTLPLASKNPFVMRANVARLAAVIRDFGVDIVHARSRAPAWSAMAAARRTGARFVTTFHGVYNGGFVKRRYNAVMARGERVIAISDYVARHVRERYGVDPQRIRMIHRGVDTRRFDPAAVSQERMIALAAKWNLPDDRRVILMPSRFSRWKGQRLVIEALSRLGRSDVLCVMVGADTGREGYVEELTDLAVRRGVESLLRFVDFCRDLPAAYMLSDAVVSASLEPEAFGRTMAEALAMGRPAVGPAHGGATEIIDEGRTGWLFTPGNSESLAGALHHALALSDSARARLAAEGLHAVRSGLTLTQMCEATLAVYAEVLGDALDAAGRAA